MSMTKGRFEVGVDDDDLIYRWRNKVADLWRNY